MRGVSGPPGGGALDGGYAGFSSSFGGIRDERTLGGIELGTLVRMSSIASFSDLPGAIAASGVASRILSLSRVGSSTSCGVEASERTVFASDAVGDGDGVGEPRGFGGGG